jgi:hypothetical protein
MDITVPRLPLLHRLVVVFPLTLLLFGAWMELGSLAFCLLRAPLIWLIVVRIAPPLVETIIFILAAMTSRLVWAVQGMLAIHTARASPLLFGAWMELGSLAFCLLRTPPIWLIVVRILAPPPVEAITLFLASMTNRLVWAVQGMLAFHTARASPLRLVVV